MGDLMRRLAACADATAVANELCVSLSDMAASTDRQAALHDVVALLTVSEERWVVVTQTLLSYMGQEVQLELLDALLEWATQDIVNINPTILNVLMQCFQLATTRLSDTGDVPRWRKWGNQVLTVVHRNEALINTPKASETEKNTTDEDCQVYLVKITMLLMQGRHQVEKDDDVTRELKTVTFIWKNLAKLATAFGPILARKYQEIDAKDHATTSFSVDELLTAVVESVEWSSGRFLRLLDDKKRISVLDHDVIQFLKLYWRAFQRILVAFVTSLNDKLEDCVVAVVNVTATFIYGSRHRLIAEISKFEKELRAMLEQTLDVIEKLAEEGADDARPCQARKKICALLWYPPADMVRAVRQRQPPEVGQTTDMMSAIQWSHLFVLTAFLGVERDSNMLSSDDESTKDSDQSVTITRLFQRYRECARADPISRSIQVTNMFLDLILQVLGRFKSMKELQLTLLKQTLYPDWMQRTLCWEIWRELVCFCWHETLAGETLHMLLDLSQWDDSMDSNQTNVLASGVEDEILDLIVFLFPGSPEYVQKWCIDQVTCVIEFISTQGPGHLFDLRLASQLNLLEKLVGVQFLTFDSGAWKNEWVANYLPICFECCGTILDLLASKGKASGEKSNDNVLGMIRVLDMCLLVLRGVFDDSNPEQEENAELSVILVRMATDALSQLAARSKQIWSLPKVGDNSKKAGSRSFGRVIATSLDLLSKLGAVLKENNKNQCVQVIQDLRVIVDSAQAMHQMDIESETVLITARFIHTTLFDIQVAEKDRDLVSSMMLDLFQLLVQASRIGSYRKTQQASLLLSVSFDALYKLLAHSNIIIIPRFSPRLGSVLEAGEVQSFKDSVLRRKLALEEILKAIETAQYRTLQALERRQHDSYRIFRNRFPEEPQQVDVQSDQSVKRQAGDDCDSGSSKKRPKRPKLDHFVSLCQEIALSLSSIEDDTTAANILSGKELADATALLHSLLAKILVS